jgi:hypothetical protein
MNEQDTYTVVVDEFKRAGWLMGVIAALGMIARLVLTNEKFKLIVWTRKVIAATIVGILVHFASHELDISDMYRSVLCAVSGSFAPELFDFVRNKFLSKLKENE